MKNPFPIFVINLKRSPERKASISKQLNDLGLECQYIEAVDGTQYTPHQAIAKYGEQVFYTNTYNKQRMTLGALGCLLSHIKFYKLMIANNIPAACVLEDDATLSPRLPEVLSSKTLQQEPWGTLLLGHYSKYRKSFNHGAEAVYWKKKVCPEHYIARAAEFPFTTLGYLIKLSTAKKLCNLAYPIRMPVDWVTGNTELVGDTLKIITPPCIISSTEYRKKSMVRDNTDTAVPVELQKEIPALSFRRYLTVGLANIILGSRSQRAQAAFDYNIDPSTYKPTTWQLKSDSTTHSDPQSSSNEIKSREYSSTAKQKISKVARRKHGSLVHAVLKIIKMRLAIEKKLWHRLMKAVSIKGSIQLSLRLILNILVMLLAVLAFPIQATSRNIYYSKVFTTIRTYIKKLGLFKYTRVI